jgi:DNA polymerase-3 subunit epsilon
MRPFSRIIDFYQEAFEASWSDSEPLDGVRFVVLDCETTGLDPRRHRIVSIGAVGVTRGQIDLSDTFEALLRVRYNTETTPVHGITRDETRNGLDEAEAIASLLGYLRDGVIVGHHIGHDLGMINAAMRRNFDLSLRNRHLDTGLLTLQLEQDGAFPEQAKLHQVTLDALCARFDILPYDRHTAAGDAFLTAQVFLRLLRLAIRHGRGTLGALLRQDLHVDTAIGV